MREMILPAIMIVFGLFYILFAVVAPPMWARSMFRLPIIFIILPERFARPIGSFITGVAMIVFGIYIGTLM